MLCQIPGISSVTAIAIMKHFSNITDLIYKVNENPGVYSKFILNQMEKYEN